MNRAEDEECDCKRREGFIVDPKSPPYIDGTELDFAREVETKASSSTTRNVKDECGCGESFRVLYIGSFRVPKRITRTARCSAFLVFIRATSGWFLLLRAEFFSC